MSPQSKYLDLRISPSNRNHLSRAIVYNTKVFDYDASDNDTIDFSKKNLKTNTIFIRYYAQDASNIPRRTYCDITIEILDLNDNIPNFRTQFEKIIVHFPSRRFEHKFNAFDADSGINGSVEYYMMPNTNYHALKLFDLNKNGLLTFKDFHYLLDTFFIEVKNFTFEIYAQDGSIFHNKTYLTVYVEKVVCEWQPAEFINFPDPAVINVPPGTPRHTILYNFTLKILPRLEERDLRCTIVYYNKAYLFEFVNGQGSRPVEGKEWCAY